MMTEQIKNKNMNMSQQDKKLDLFLRQKETLDLFLERGAISQAQYTKSLGDLRDKMGITMGEELNE